VQLSAKDCCPGGVGHACNIGIGLRFSVLESRRTDMRLYYGRSKDSDAIQITAGEVFELIFSTGSLKIFVAA